jgi:hypothetical protein
MWLNPTMRGFACAAIGTSSGNLKMKWATLAEDAIAYCAADAACQNSQPRQSARETLHFGNVPGQDFLC